MANRVTSLDPGYRIGDLSVFPDAIDTPQTLYVAANNAESTLTQSLNYTGKFMVLADGGAFAPHGIVRVEDELIYYGVRQGNVLSDLQRGYAGSRQTQHRVGVVVSGSVMAEYQNALRDAVYQLETKLGTATAPATGSLNDLLTQAETKHLAPKPLFRAFPLAGKAPLKVRFQNFSGGPPIRFFWEFGDGTTSLEENPTHTYAQNGIYSVRFSVITSLLAQGVVTKTNYITVDDNAQQAFFYADRLSGVRNVTTFTLVDQSDGDIAARYWLWDDGTNTTVDDPDVHTASHVYTVAGSYSPILLVVYTSGRLQRVGLNEELIVT